MQLQEILVTQRKGRCLTELQEKLQEVVKAVSATGKTGKLKLVIKIIPKGETVELHDDIDASIPKPNKFGTIFYPDEKTGALSREDPEQPELPVIAKMADAVNQ